MQPPDLVTLFVAPLNDLGIPYMVTRTRFTRDLDVVMTLGPADADRIAAAFPAADFYVPPREVMREESARPEHGHFNLIHHDTTLKADCYVAGRDPLHAWAVPRRVRHDVGGVPVWAAPIEYVILRKLQWHRDGGAARHLDDVRAMLRVSGDDLDGQALGDWVTRLGLEEEWRLVGG